MAVLLAAVSNGLFTNDSRVIGALGVLTAIAALARIYGKRRLFFVRKGQVRVVCSQGGRPVRCAGRGFHVKSPNQSVTPQGCPKPGAWLEETLEHSRLLAQEGARLHLMVTICYRVGPSMWQALRACTCRDQPSVRIVPIVAKHFSTLLEESSVQSPIDLEQVLKVARNKLETELKTMFLESGYEMNEERFNIDPLLLRLIRRPPRR